MGDILPTQPLANGGRAKEPSNNHVFRRKALVKHKELVQYESLLVAQMRTGKDRPQGLPI